MTRAVTCFALALFVGAYCSGCATIMGKSEVPVTITSQPDGAEVSIFDRSGKPIHTGITPTTVSLRAGAGYFKSEVYKVRFARAGYQEREAEIERRVNGWYIGGNFVFGGIIGWLVVDPATGAMWKLLDLHVDLHATDDAPTFEVSLKFLDLKQVPEDLRVALIPVN